jgi:hypothetical protein
MCDVNSCNVFLLLFMALWVLISATLFRRTVLVLWHGFMFLGLRFFPPLFFFAWWPPLLFLVRNFIYMDDMKIVPHKYMYAEVFFCACVPARREPKISLAWSVLNSEPTSGVIRKFHMRQHVYQVLSIVANETT